MLGMLSRFKMLHCSQDAGVLTRKSRRPRQLLMAVLPHWSTNRGVRRQLITTADHVLDLR